MSWYSQNVWKVLPWLINVDLLRRWCGYLTGPSSWHRSVYSPGSRCFFIDGLAGGQMVLWVSDCMGEDPHWPESHLINLDTTLILSSGTGFSLVVIIRWRFWWLGEIFLSRWAGWCLDELVGFRLL